jgi:predicted nucleotidyltransferase
MKKVCLKEKYLKILADIFSKCLINQKCEVLLFGSRAKGKCMDMSDIDIAIKCNEEKQPPLYKIKDMLEESVIPFNTDVLNYSKAPDSWKNSIDKTGILIWKN